MGDVIAAFVCWISHDCLKCKLSRFMQVGLLFELTSVEGYRMFYMGLLFKQFLIEDSEQPIIFAYISLCSNLLSRIENIFEIV